MAIKEVSEQRINEIREKTPYGLPDDPSANGMSAEQVKKAFYGPLTDDEISVLAELNRVVREANTLFERREVLADAGAPPEATGVLGKLYVDYKDGKVYMEVPLDGSSPDFHELAFGAHLEAMKKALEKKIGDLEIEVDASKDQIHVGGEEPQNGDAVLWIDDDEEGLSEEGVVQSNLLQNDPAAPDYVRGRTHYTGLMYSDYIDYFDVHPNKVGVGVYPLVLSKEGQNFGFDNFLDPENLKASYSASTGNRMATELVLRVYLKVTGGEANFKVRTWSETFIDEENYKFDANPALGLTIYAIRDITALTEEYKNMFPENGLYLEVGVDQSTVAAGYCLNVSFKVYEYKAIDEKYIPSIVPRTSTAAVGQTIAVKAVDGLGKPTEWEAVDMGGGGSDKWEIIAEADIKEWASIYTIDKDLNGNPFALKKMMIYMELPKCTLEDGTEDVTGYTNYLVNDKGTWCYPSGDWHNGKFTWEIEACGDVCLVRCYKSANHWHAQTMMYKAGDYDAIRSFTYKNFNTTRGYATCKYKVYGVRV